MLRPEWVKVEDVIRIGVEWLRSDQLDGALLTHLGLGAHAGGGLHVQFAPNGRLAGNRSKRRDAVIVVDLDPYVPGTYDPETADRSTAERMLPFTLGEIGALRSLIIAAGLPVVHEWNGAGLHTGSFAVSDSSIASSLSATVDKYHRGCPDHRSVFCGPGAHNPAERDCTWFSASRDLLVEPVFPAVPYPAPPAPPAPSDDDRNLDAVRRALRAITPILAEMGIHPATVVAGRRGHIDEHEDGSLEFVPDGGHGVLIPAETAERLVAAAWAAVEADIDH